MITVVVLDVDGGQLIGIESDYKKGLRRRTEDSTKNLQAYVKEKEEEI